MNKVTDLRTLPFTTLEEYMLLNESSAYSMESIRFLHFTGILSREALQSAFTALCERHPLLTYRAQRIKNSLVTHFEWAPSEKKPELVWQRIEETSESLSESGFPNVRKLNLFQEPGFRVYVIECVSENWTKALLQFHHGVLDGLGEMSIIGELLTLYARFAKLIPEDTPLPRVEVEKLPLRGRLGWSLCGFLRNYFPSVVTALRLANAKPNPLFPHTPVSKNAPKEAYSFLQSLPLSQKETESYIKKAKRLGVTVNDLLLRDLFATIDTWRTQVNKDYSTGYSCIQVPTSLRTEFHEGMPTVNIVSSVFLNRTKKQISGDKQQLLEGIHREMEWNKKHDQKYVILLILIFLKKIGALPFCLKSKKCLATAVLSNLGRVLERVPLPRNDDGTIQLGDSRLLFIDAGPPILKSLISFSALTYAGALRLCLRYNSHFMTRKETEQLLSIFREMLLE